MGKYCALKKAQQTNASPPQYLFQINCFSLKAMVTNLERFSNPAEHSSVELLPQEAAVLALPGRDPGQNASKTFVSTSLQSQAAEPTPLRATQNLSVPSLSPFSSLSTWGCTGERKSSSSPFCALAKARGEKGSGAGAAGPSRG